jgi:hypothetical protein
VRIEQRDGLALQAGQSREGGFEVDLCSIGDDEACFELREPATEIMWGRRGGSLPVG